VSHDDAGVSALIVHSGIDSTGCNSEMSVTGRKHNRLEILESYRPDSRNRRLQQ
jgi:hypothetical protein